MPRLHLIASFSIQFSSVQFSDHHPFHYRYHHLTTSRYPCHCHYLTSSNNIILVTRSSLPHPSSPIPHPPSLIPHPPRTLSKGGCSCKQSIAVRSSIFLFDFKPLRPYSTFTLGPSLVGAWGEFTSSGHPTCYRRVWPRSTHYCVRWERLACVPFRRLSSAKHHKLGPIICSRPAPRSTLLRAGNPKLVETLFSGFAPGRSIFHLSSKRSWSLRTLSPTLSSPAIEQRGVRPT